MIESKILVRLFGLLVCCEVIFATNKPQQIKLSNKGCFHCSGFDGGVCINLLADAQTNHNLSSRCNNHTKHLTAGMQMIYGNEFQKSVAYATDLKCVFYVKRNYSGEEHVYQGCISRREAQDFCPKMMQNESTYRYQLIKCVVCSNEYCNGGVLFGPRFYNIGLVATSVIIYNILRYLS